MVAVPAVMPVTLPVEPTVAIPGDPELHVPFATASASVVTPPKHNVAVPVIAGAAFTVTVVVAKQPDTPEAE